MYESFIRNLKEERAGLIDQARAVLDHASAQRRDLNGEEQATVARVESAISDLDAQVRDWEERNTRERAADVARGDYGAIVRGGASPVSASGGFDAELRDALLGRREFVDVPFGREFSERRTVRSAGGVQQRDLLKVAAASGGDTVPTSFLHELMDYLEVETPLFKVARVINTMSGENLEVPKVVTHGTAAIVGEGTALAEVDPTFSKVTFGAWKYGQLLQISRELLEDTGVDLGGFVAEDMGRALGRVVGAALTNGTGTNAPLGYNATIGTAVTANGTHATALFYEHIIDLIYGVASPYRRNGSILAHDTWIKSALKVDDGAGHYIFSPSVLAGAPDTILGYPVYEDPNLAAFGTSAKSAAFGDWRRAYGIRVAAGVRVERSDHFAFSSELATYRATMRVDGDYLDLTGAIRAYAGGTA